MWERESTRLDWNVTIKSLMDACTVQSPVAVEDRCVDGILINLKGYQFENLQWMLQRENEPLDSLLWAKVKEDLYFSPCLNFWKQSTEDCYGGILADAMGMGKTLTMLSLISATRDTAASFYYKNLVVVPTTLLGQWENEIKTKTNLSVIVHYGPRRRKEPEHLRECEIVLTTYGIVRSDFSVFEAYKWNRIILDESHTIKNFHSTISRKLRQLPSRSRWCVSGTPFVTTINDICSQLAFLGFMKNRGFFRRMVENNYSRLHYILRRIMRKRNQCDINLLPTRQHVVHLSLPEEQQLTYNELFRAAQRNRYTMNTLHQLREYCSNGHHKSRMQNEIKYLIDPHYSPETCAICLDVVITVSKHCAIIISAKIVCCSIYR